MWKYFKQIDCNVIEYGQVCFVHVYIFVEVTLLLIAFSLIEDDEEMESNAWVWEK